MAEDEGRKTIDNIDFRGSTYTQTEFTQTINDFCASLTDLTSIGSKFIDLRDKLLKSGYTPDAIDLTFIKSLNPDLLEHIGFKEKFEDALSEIFFFMNKIGMPILDSMKETKKRTTFLQKINFPFFVTTLTKGFNFRPNTNRLLIRDNLVRELLNKSNIDVSKYPNLDGIMTMVFMQDILRYEL